MRAWLSSNLEGRPVQGKQYQVQAARYLEGNARVTMRALGEIGSSEGSQLNVCEATVSTHRGLAGGLVRLQSVGNLIVLAGTGS